MKIYSVIMVSFLLLTAWAAGEKTLSSLEVLQKENTALRSEIIRISGELTLMKQWLAGMVSAEKELDKENAAAIRLAKMAELQKSGIALALKADAVSKLFRKELNSGKYDSSSRIKYSMILDELDETVRSFSSYAIRNENVQKELQIIAIDSKLQLAVLSGGSSDGIITGMILFPKNRPGSKLKLRVISVRPGVCAADLQEGEWSDVIPGMLLTPFRSVK